MRTAQSDDDGNVNPLKGEAATVYSACVSQPCRTLHDFVLLGFNEDEGGRKAIDGVVNWIGGADGIFMNYRFAQPFRTHRQHINRWFPEFQVPFTNQVRLDSVTRKVDGRLARCSASATCPKVFEVNSANEYWAKDMAVAAVDDAGNDLRDEPANVRSYFMASLPHQAGVVPLVAAYVSRTAIHLWRTLCCARSWSPWTSGHPRVRSRQRAEFRTWLTGHSWRRCLKKGRVSPKFLV